MSKDAQELDRIDAEVAHSCWDEAADAWDHFVESGLDFYRTRLHGPALLEACEPVRGLDVLDLGCGQGWFSRQLAGRGARVQAIDWSERLIEHARRHEAEAKLGIAYEVLDAARIGERFGAQSFDLVTACMSIMDMPEPGTVLARARPLLRERGRLVMSVPNPATDTTYREWERDAYGRKQALKIDGYFEAATTMLDWGMRRLATRFRTVQYRHTLEQWSRMIEDAGFVIARLREPRPTSEVLANCPELAAAARLPFFLIFELKARGS
jgi:2-polyprenyl-3-methyl-5-hydroxy-6-metoxy-1,4-benzoquinol methylase